MHIVFAITLVVGAFYFIVNFVLFGVFVMHRDTHI